MHNVQLLVVNREDRAKLCNVGEVGELYVRAAGLAQGYKGDQALNDQKFLSNWFIPDHTKWEEADRKANKGEPWRKYYNGPKDRLYRTGDLVSAFRRILCIYQILSFTSCQKIEQLTPRATAGHVS